MYDQSSLTKMAQRAMYFGIFILKRTKPDVSRLKEPNLMYPD